MKLFSHIVASTAFVALASTAVFAEGEAQDDGLADHGHGHGDQGGGGGADAAEPAAPTLAAPRKLTRARPPTPAE